MSTLTIINSSAITITNQTIYIDNITCAPSGGDGPTNYYNYCIGNKPFNISTLTGVANGYIKMIVDAGTGDIGLQKEIGGTLALNEVSITPVSSS